MGAKGSTRWKGYTPRATVESCVALRAAELGAAVSSRGERLNLSVPPGGESLTITFSVLSCRRFPAMTRYYRVVIQSPNQQNMELEPVASICGDRWFLRCPRRVSSSRFCYRRVAVLYLPAGSNEFACRLCLNLTYNSTRTKKRAGRDLDKSSEPQ
jgi:hypothetical protein